MIHLVRSLLKTANTRDSYLPYAQRTNLSSSTSNDIQDGTTSSKAKARHELLQLHRFRNKTR